MTKDLPFWEEESFSSIEPLPRGSTADQWQWNVHIQKIFPAIHFNGIVQLAVFDDQCKPLISYNIFFFSVLFWPCVRAVSAYSLLLERFFCDVNANSEAAGYKSSILNHLEGKIIRPRKRNSVFIRNPASKNIKPSVRPQAFKSVEQLSIRRANTTLSARMFPQRVRLWCGGGLCRFAVEPATSKPEVTWFLLRQLEFTHVYW